MLIKIGYDIALRFPNPTSVIHLLHVQPSRRSDLIAPEHFSTEPALPVEPYMTTSVTIADDSVLLPAPSAFLAKQLSVTAVHPMPTCQTRRTLIFLKLIPLLWSFYCRVGIVKSTASLWISPGKPFRKRDPDGVVFKRFATLSMNIFNSIITKLVSIELHLKL